MSEWMYLPVFEFGFCWYYVSLSIFCGLFGLTFSSVKQVNAYPWEIKCLSDGKLLRGNSIIYIFLNCQCLAYYVAHSLWLIHIICIINTTQQNLDLPYQRFCDKRLWIWIYNTFSKVILEYKHYFENLHSAHIFVCWSPFIFEMS